jgi:hypothetical protein
MVRLSLLLPVVVAGLMLGATCGAPDEVVRVEKAQPAGVNTGGSGGGSSTPTSNGTGGVEGSATSTPPAGGSSRPSSAGSSGGTVGGTSATGGRSGTGGTGGRAAGGTSGGTGGGPSAGGSSASGGASTTGGRTGTGGISAARSTGTGGRGTGGASGTGGSTSLFGGNGSAGSTSTGGRSGTGAGGTSMGGRTGTSGTVGGSGGASGRGGAGGSTSPTSTTPVPNSGLDVYVTQAISGSTGQINLRLRIDNKTASSVDMSTVTLRYWYQDEGLGTTLVFNSDYVSIGYSNQGTVAGRAAAASPAATGADHYIELSFTGTLAAQGDKASNDQFNVQVTVHTANYQGAVDVTNDYSYNGGAIGYDSKITLYQSGKLVWGTAPG